MQRSSSSLKRLGVTASSRKCFSGWPILHATNACTYSSQAFNLPATMKGVQLSSFGDTSVLDYLEDLPLPPLESASDVLVKVSHSSVNPIDLAIRNGYGKALLPLKRDSAFPITLGFDMVGTIVAVGSGVWNFKVGDRVWGAIDPFKGGCQVEYTAVNETYLSKAPSTISDVEAATIPYVGLTSWRALVETAGLGGNKKKKVFINGGSGGVGFFSVQLTKHFGHSIATTCSTDNIPKVMGAVGVSDRVLDYRTTVFDQLLEDDFDVVLDTVGGEKMEERCCSILRNGGHYLGLQGPLLKSTDEQGIAMGLLKGVSEILAKKARHGVGANSLTRLNKKGKSVKFDYVLYRPNGAALSRIGALVDKGAIRPDLDKVFPLSQLREAHDYCEQGKAKGKVVIQVAK